MLFSYQYVPHRIETFQVWLDHLVKEVWCKATGDFSLHLLHPELRIVVEAILNDGKIKKGQLDRPIRQIYEIFKTQLNAAQRQQVSVWYDNNNDIEALCACNQGKLPVTYAELKAIHPALADEVERFCTSLWSNVLDLSHVKKLIGEVAEHYTAFVAANKVGKCPYCGYNDIKGVNNTRREAYDHFLPKGIYPFNSVNFRNLAPMCHECNSSYKLQLDATRHVDPIKRKNTETRRKAFYTFAAVSPTIRINLILNTKDVTKLKKEEIDLQITCPGHEEEVESWREVFGIDERYRAKCCAENDGMAWILQIIDECHNPEQALTRGQLLAMVYRAADRSPYDGAHFLKKPFLQACEDAQLFE